jgi:hypothetical protein
MWIMFKKERFESEELRALKALNFRMKLEDKDKQYYLNLQKGFEGEVMFDEYLHRIAIETYMLNDLLFELNHSHFQIGALMISENLNYLFEVKNYEGEYYFEGDKFKNKNGSEVKNPLLQLDRNEALLRQLFNSIGVKTPIAAFLVFINPEFTLYQAPLDRRTILPTNLNRFIKQISNQKSILNNHHDRLSKKLLSSHLTKSPFSKIPKYDYAQLRKGVFCHSCGTVMEEFRPVLLTCNKCGMHENSKNALLRIIEEYQILYPTNKITTNIIYEWSGGIFPKKTIRKILKEKFIALGSGKWSYYE